MIEPNEASKYALTPEQWRALRVEISTIDAAKGEEYAFSCNMSADDHLHLQRVGLPGETHTRVGVGAHAGGAFAGIYLHPVEARAVAAALLNIADEIDGTTPLVFHPPRVIEKAELDDPEAEV